jgi:cell division protein ZapA
MSVVTLSIAGRNYDLACRPGEEAHFEQLAAVVDAKAKEAAAALGGMSEVRQLMFAALLLADDLDQAAKGTAPVTPTVEPAEDVTPLVLALAERLERLADGLEKDAGNP